MYAFKLKQLENMKDLAQEGKLTYEIFDSTDGSKFDETSEATLDAVAIADNAKEQRRYRSEVRAKDDKNVILDTSVLVKPS